MRKLTALIICLVMLTALSGCMDFLDALEDALYGIEEPQYTSEPPRTPDQTDNQDLPDVQNPQDNQDLPDIIEIPDSRDLPDSGEYRHFDRDNETIFDMSSAEAFIEDVYLVCGVILEDNNGFLSASFGKDLMHEIDAVLKLFSPAFIKEMVIFYATFGSDLIICLEGEDEEMFGYVVWDLNADLIITLYHSSDPDENGVSLPTLTHELAHAAHFIVEEYIGEKQSEQIMRAFNGRFDYLEDDYEHKWNEVTHGTAFAYDYGLYDYYEDWATTIEMFTMFDHLELTDRLSVWRNEPLFRKAQYVRDMMYHYISDDCHQLFAPLYEAEEYMKAAA